VCDVLLTHSYHLFYDRKQLRKMQPYPPLGTLYAAALLRSRGFSVAVFDTMLNDPVEFRDALCSHRPKMVAVYEDNFNFLTKMCLTRMREVAYGMLDAARESGAVAVVNGSDASDHAEEFLRRGFAYVLLGEAEVTLLELVQGRLGGGGNAHEIPGLAYLKKDHAVRTTARELMCDLDALPFPARDLINVEQYRRAWKQAHGTFSMNMVSSRGCPYRCNWCAKPIYGNAFHARSAASVADEMRELKQVYGAEHLWFADDIFALRPSWAAELAEGVEQRDARVPFKMQSRVDLMTRPTVAALRRAGCAEVWMGAESGSQTILDAMEKDTRVEQIAAARENLRRHGIRACYFLQFGYPNERWEDIQKTVELVRRTRPDDVGVSVSYPLPGTRFYERVREELGAKTNWSDSEDLCMMFHGTYTDSFYRALHDALHAEVELWNTAPGASAERVRQLWEVVAALEKTCRTEKPTLLPVLRTAQACSAD
jgi:anaerobic magnesium-protoporphyrin IX monomethyl ester cyclase